MAFDWSVVVAPVVVAPVVGAAIGLVGEWSGRRGARRDAEQFQERAERKAAEARAIQLEEARQHRIEERERQALEAILASMMVFPAISVAVAEPAEARAALAGFAPLCAIESLYVVSSELRGLLLVAVEVVDLTSKDRLETFTLAESLYITRHVLRHAIAAHLRRERSLLPLTDDWRRLSAEALAVISRSNANDRRPGFDAESWTDGLTLDPDVNDRSE